MKQYLLTTLLLLATPACAQSIGPSGIQNDGSNSGGGGSGVSSFTGDGALISNSASTGAVTSTLTNATAKSLWGNSSSSSGAPSYLTAPVVSGSSTAAAFIPSSSTIPTDGLYLPTASTSGIADNSQPVVKFSGVASAVDFLTLTNAATASPAALLETATGTDSNITISLLPKGSGGVAIGTTAVSSTFSTEATINQGANNVGLQIDSASTFGAAFILNSTAPGGKTWQFFSSTTSDSACGNAGGCFGIAIPGSFTPFTMNTSGVLIGESTGVYGWSNQTTFPSANDTGLSRVSANVIGVGNGAAGNVSGTIEAAQYNVGTSQIAAANLSNGTTGSGGGVVLATSPTIASPALTGTVTGNNTIPLTILAQAAANTMVGNWTGSTANEVANVMPSCADSGGNHLNYVNGTGVTCGTSGGGGTITLGTSVSATNPQRSSQAGTGLYSDTTNTVGVATNSLKAAVFDSSGVILQTYLSSTAHQSMKQTLATATGQNLTAGSILSSVAVGPDALAIQDNNGGNTAFGGGALGNMSGIGAAYANAGFTVLGNGFLNTAIGMQAMGAATANGCTAGGGFGAYGTAVGAFALYNMGCTVNAINNTAIGEGAGFSVTTGNGNTIVGGDAQGSTTGSFNTIIGYNAGGGAGSSNSMTSAASNTIIGAQVATTTLVSGSNNILIGVNNAIDTAAAGTNNTINIGGSAGSWVLVTGTGTTTTETTTMSGVVKLPNLATSSASQTGTVCSGTGGLLTVDTTTTCLLSLEELKDIQNPITNALDTIMKIKPFWFRWKTSTPEYVGDKAEQPGMGAHQVEGVDKRLVAYNPDGRLKGVRYQEMTAMLVAAVKEQQNEITHMRAVNDNPCNAFNWLGRKLFCN